MTFEHFVVHYTPLKERKHHIQKEFENHGISDFTLIESYDREHLTKEQLSRFEKISESEISLFYKHIEVFKRQSEKKFEGVICVYEDDAVLCEHFLEKIKVCMEQLPQDWDLVFGGECADLHEWYRTDGQLIYPRDSSRGACFYMVNSKCISKILDLFESKSKIECAVDWWFNCAIRELGLKNYWTEPTLVKQASELGWFKKSIDITL